MFWVSTVAAVDSRVAIDFPKRGNHHRMSESSDEQTRPACPACGARLAASYEPGEACPKCEDGTLVALPEVMESDLGQQSDVAGSGLGQRSDSMGGLTEFSSPPDFSGGLGDQDTTTRTESIPEQTGEKKDESRGEEQPDSGPASRSTDGRRRVGQSVSESAGADDPVDEWSDASTDERPSLPEMQSPEAEKIEAEPPSPSGESDSQNGPVADGSEPDTSSKASEPDSSGGFVPPPSSVVEELPEEEDVGRSGGADQERSRRTSDETDRDSSAPAPMLPDDAGGGRAPGKRADDRSAGHVDPTVSSGGRAGDSTEPDRPSAEELLEEEEEWPKREEAGESAARGPEKSVEGSVARSGAGGSDASAGESSARTGEGAATPSPTQSPSSTRGTGTASGPESSSTGWGRWAVAVATVVIVAAGASALLLTDFLDFGASDSAPSNGASTEPDRLLQARTSALEAARSRVDEAVQVDTEDPELRRSVADALAEEGRATEASRIFDVLWRNGSRSESFTNEYLDLLIQGQRYHRARLIALAGARLHESSQDFRERYDQAVEADPVLGDPEPVELERDIQIQSISRAKNRDVEALFVSVSTDDHPDYIFLPETSDDRTWRNDVGAWRLCKLLGCAFEIPWTREARISRAAFTKHGGEADGKIGRAGPNLEETSAYRWRSPERSDSEYLYGALRKWPGEMARWPIEAFEVWQPWMRAGRDEGRLETRAATAWQAFESEVGQKSVERLARETSDSSLRPIAGQFSDILVFDYLTNNWGRFASDASKYGSNNHFQRGRFVTVETGTTFQRRHSRRVSGRFEWTELFREETIQALRWMKRDRALSIVYPDPSSIEKAKFRLVWEQRNRVLERVESLVDEHGARRIFPFSVVPLWPADAWD